MHHPHVTDQRLAARRDALKTLARSAAAVAWLPLAIRAQEPAPADEPQKVFTISLAEWSLHRTLQAGKLDHLDFAKTAKTDFGIENVEYVNQFMKDKATDKDYLAQMQKRAGDHGVKSILIMCDGEGDLGDPDAKKRLQAVENHKKWAAAAKTLGCHCIRVNAHSQGSEDEQKKLVADGLRKLTEYAASACDISVVVENHGGLSSNGAWLSGVMKLVDHRRCGTLPDFGNFDLGGGRTYDRYKGVEEMMPYAKAVSAKSHDFDAKGEETKTNYRKMLEIVVVKGGYRGRCIGIEYEGERLSEPDGIRATKKLLEAVRLELVKLK
jgi:L-ribulose-5-phosphate 3-epimerase